MEARKNYNKKWQEFQKQVAELFKSMPECDVSINYPIQGSRIRNVNIDVYVEFQSSKFRYKNRHRFVFKVLIECKYWQRKVPQEKIFTFKTIVEDIGASMGLIITSKGLQSGANEYLKKPSNIMALTFTQLKAMAHNLPLGYCTKCGKECILPFESQGGNIFCGNCLPRRRNKIVAKS